MVDTLDDFENISLNGGRNFSWVFLVDWILVVILCLTVMFYLNRAFAYAINQALEWIVWKHFKVKISVESIRFSLLGGRVFFKNLTIIEKDHTVSFLQGCITWRYWLLRTRSSQFSDEGKQGEGEEEKESQNWKLPCRFLIECDGLEMFIYNRTISYNNIINKFSKEEKSSFAKFLFDNNLGDLLAKCDDLANSADADPKEYLNSANNSTSDETKIGDELENTPDMPKDSEEFTAQNDRIFNQPDKKHDSYAFLKFLPIELRLKHISIVLGNKFTPSLMIISADSGVGSVDYSQSNEKLDLFTNRYKLEFKNVLVAMKQNIGYNEEVSIKFKLNRGKLSKLWKRFSKITGLITRPLGLTHKKDKNAATNAIFLQKWQGLMLYKGAGHDLIDDELDDIEFDFSSHEYAKSSTILKTSKIEFTYEMAIPGRVPHGAHRTISHLDGPDVGNNGAPPTNHLDVQICGGSLSYGPWAQRQVGYIQALLMPTATRSETPVKKLSPGQRRIYTVFTISIGVTDDTTWRVPTREPSKDAVFLQHYKETKDEYRPFGWTDVKFSKDSSADIMFVLCPTVDGIKNNINIHLTNSEIRSSVNHDIFLKCQYFNFNLLMHYPLGWNDKYKWKVDMSSAQAEIFLLREHMTLISDIATDFTSNSPSPYEQFRPSIFELTWLMNGYSIYLNVNDHNIINNPLDFNENCYLSLHGDKLVIDLSVPNDSITNTRSTIDYKIHTPMYRLLLNAPPWNTLNEFMKHKEVGRSYDFTASGSYIHYTQLGVDNVDEVIIDCVSKSTTLHCYGFVIRYIMNVQENYFGGFSHFITAEEYTDNLASAKPAHMITDVINPESGSKSFRDIDTNGSSVVHDKPDDGISPLKLKRNENESEVWFTFSVIEGALILPETNYNANPCTGMHFSELVIDLRNNNYYMDILATLSNINLKRYINKHPNDIYEWVHKNNSADFPGFGTLSDLSICGHRMYGLPPEESTYFCKWDIDIGDLNTNSTLEVLKGFGTAIQKIKFGHDDLENILLYQKEVVDDMTSVTLNVSSMELVINSPDPKSFLSIRLNDLSVSSIDFMNERYTDRQDIKLPNLKFSLYGYESDNDIVCFFNFETKLNFSNFARKKNHMEETNKQRNYMAISDAPFHRLMFLLPEEYQNAKIYTELYGSIVPSSSLPPVPLPILPETIDIVIEQFLGDYSHLIETDEIKNAVDYEISGPQSLSKTSTKHSGFGVMTGFQKVSSSSSSHLEQDDMAIDQSDLVFDINYISLELNPNVGIYLQQFLKAFYDESVIDVLDGIEIGIVNNLGKLNEGNSVITNVKLRILYFDIFWGIKKQSGIELFLEKIDFEMSEKELEENREKVVKDLVLLMKSKSVRITISETGEKELENERPPALSLVLEGAEAWSTTNEDQMNSVKVASTDFTVDESQVEWLFEFFSIQDKFIKKVTETFNEIQRIRSGSRKALISKLTAASEHYQISHDSYVITKPAFIMRLSRGHIRENRSWKIITRLRHILTYLPDNWDTTIDSSFKNKNVNTLKDAKEIFMSVFSNWRNWEFSDVARSYIYNKLFLEGQIKHDEDSMRRTIKASISSFFITVYTEGYEVDHNFVVTEADFLLEQTPQYSELGISREKNINLTGRVGTIKGKFSDKLMKMQDLIPVLKSEDDNQLKRVKTMSRTFKLNVMLLFDHSELQLAVGRTNLINTINGGTVSMLWESPKEYTSQAGSIILFSETSELWLKHRDVVLAEGQFHDLSISGTAESWSNQPTFVINSQCSDLHLRAMANTDVLVSSIGEIEGTIQEIKKNWKPSKKSINSSYLNEHKINAEVLFFLSNVSIEIMPLSPFQCRSEIRKVEIVFKKYDTRDILLSVWDTDIYVSSNFTKQQYFRISLGDLQLKYNIENELSTSFNIGISASIAKLTFSEPHRMVGSYLQDERIASQSFAQFEKLIPIFERLAVGKNYEPTNKKRCIFDADITYVGVLIPISTTFFVLEFHNLLGSYTDMDNIKNVNEDEVSGQVSAENIFFLIKDRDVPTGLSKLVDLSLKFSTAQKATESDKSFQLESNHFRVCLSPFSFVRLIWGNHQLMTLFEYYQENKIQNLWNYKTIDKIFNNDDNNETSSELPLKLSSIHILSYNFCVGWVFQDRTANEPGVMLGFNRLFSAYEKGFGKLTLIEAFLSVANGNTSSTFYSKGNEKDRFNRSYLPNMQISYWFEKFEELKDVYVRFHGEALDVNFLPLVIEVVESCVKSVEVFQHLKKTLIKIPPSKNKKKKVAKESDPRKTFAPLFSSIRSVNCQFKYDGGVFKVYSIHDYESKLDPTFEVKSPGVQIYLDYRHDPEARKPHWIRGLVNIESTYNLLYAKCAPLIAGFVIQLQSIVTKYNESEKREMKAVPATPSPIGTDIDYKRLLDPIDMAFKITSSEQKLSLSCEPKAKVQSDIGFGSFTFDITTNEKEDLDPFNVSLVINQTEASIKHVFSREASTSFKIDLINLTMMFTHPDVINVYGAALISDVDVYFNMKQLQNLYLFMDIWMLSRLLKSKPIQNLSRESSHLSIPKVANINIDTPWSFTLIFTNINGDVDLGSSLGLISLKLKRTWIASDHFQDKRQLLYTFIDDARLLSQGRLSGVLEVIGASSIIEVNWPHESFGHRYPLVSLSANIDNVSVKAAFDYHMFLIGTIFNTKFHLHSEMDLHNIMPDLLKVRVTCDAINVCSTALVAANIIDLYNTIMRMRQDNKISYLETLRESNSSDTKTQETYEDIIKSLNLLQTDVSVDISTLNIQISPISLYDIEVLVVNIGKLSASSGTHSGVKVKTDLNLMVCDAYVALSTSKKEMDEDTVSKISVEDYMKYAAQISGGTIVEMPMVKISMTTWQEENSNILEFIYDCTFGDKVGVKWNLGPVNFIKEMWATHVRAMAVRHSQNATDMALDNEEDVEKRLKEEESTSKFIYVPLRDPKIDMPQIKDLGDATPPLEWFGVNRKRLPTFTHLTVVKPVQQIVHTAEQQYASIIGHSQ